MKLLLLVISGGIVDLRSLSLADGGVEVVRDGLDDGGGVLFVRVFVELYDVHVVGVAGGVRVLFAPVGFVVEVLFCRVNRLRNVCETFSVNQGSVGVPFIDNVKGNPQRLDVVLEGIIGLVGL